MVLRIGHRGASGHEPENTLRSFRKALDLGADMVELDVHLCGTGELVVIHDETVDRTTDGTGSVSDMSFDELRGLDAGKGERIPTLREVLDHLEGRAGVNIELKAQGTAEPVHEAIRDAIGRPGWSHESILVTSFHLGELTELRDLSDEARIGVLVSGDPREVLGYAEMNGAYSVNPHFGRTSREFVVDAHGRGLKVFVWTVNELGDIERMKAMGVDGIISDYPDRV